MLDCNHILDVLATSFLETLSPTRCVVCDEPGAILCAHCAFELPFIDLHTACPRCAAPYGRLLCTECPLPGSEQARTQPDKLFPFSHARAALSYEGGTKRIIRTYKDGDELRLDMVIASFICQALRGRVHSGKAHPAGADENPCADWTQWADAIVAIPASPDALVRRGFDHMARVAQLCSSWTGLPLLDILAYTKKTIDQRALGKGQRQTNATGSFAVTDAGMRVPDRIILVDDVMTTGATTAAAAKALLEGGAREVVVAVCARVW